MATMALPICDLENSVRIEAEKALAVTEAVVSQSKAMATDFKTLWQVIAGTASLRLRLSHLVVRQAKFISALQDHDFTKDGPEVIQKVASSLGDLVSDERAVLRDAYSLGSEIRFWWRHSLRQLEEQVEHLDSIAESLHIECDGEASALLAMAVEQVARHSAAEQLALS